MPKKFPLERKIRSALLGLSLAVFALPQSSRANYENRFEANLRIESEFKSLATAIVELLAEDGSDSAWKEKIIKHRWKLKSLAETHPESVWADDAQYIFAVLGASEGLLVPEFEYLLARFPNAKAEPWTLEMFEFMIPDESPLDFAVRKHLCVRYKALHKKRKLRQLVKKSAGRYPERAEIFQSFLDSFNPAEQLEPDFPVKAEPR